ncbi:hypothetical protein D3C73_1080480 [compost metagenome]
MARFPSTETGLNHLQYVCLDLIFKGETSVIALFEKIGQVIPDYGLADLQFWGIIEDMRICHTPLVELIGGGRFPRFNERHPEGFDSWQLELTKAGLQVLQGNFDHVRLNGIDDWVGGVHLMTGNKPVWRWDKSNERLVQA